MSNFEAAATEVFQILRSYDYSVELFDDEGNQVYEPEEARRFFAEPRGIMVALNDAGENSSMRLYIGRNTEPTDIMGLARTLRMSAWKFNLLFAFRRFDAKEIKVKDFATHHSVREHAEHNTGDHYMDITEGMYGTSRSSYLRLENARMIVRHKTKVNEASVGARGRNIGSIYIEDAQGQRFLFPTQNLAPARAMAQHVNQGGNFADQVGEAIRGMAEDYRALLNTSRHIGRHAGQLDESCGMVREACREKMSEMRKTFSRMFRESGYHSEAQRLAEEANALVETDESRALKEARARKLCEMLAVEGVELDEGQMGRVAGCIKCDALNGMNEGRKAYGESDPKVKVLGGLEVNADAWGKFISTPGHLDMFAPPGKAVSVPQGYKGAPKPTPYAKADEAMAEHLLMVAPSVKDLSLGNLLMKVAERLPVETQEKNARVLRAIAARALTLAHKPVPKPEDLARNAPAVRQFHEWLEGFDPVRSLLGENPGWGVNDVGGPYLGAELPHSDRLDGQVQNVVDEFSMDDFLKSDAFIRSNIDHDGLTVSRSALKAALLCYLEDRFEKEHETWADMEDEASELVEPVMKHLQGQGFILTEDEMVDDDMLLPPEDSEPEGDEIELTDTDVGADMAADGAALMDDVELTDEDILLPKAQKDDLRDEVTKPTITDPDTGEEREPDDGYINRLRQLAGQRQGIPR